MVKYLAKHTAHYTVAKTLGSSSSFWKYFLEKQIFPTETNIGAIRKYPNKTFS